MTANLRRLPSASARVLYKAADEALDRKTQAIRAVLGVTTAGLGIGAAGRGLMDAYRTGFPSKPMDDSNPLLPRQITVPVVRRAAQDEDDRKRLGLEPGTDLQDEALNRQRALSLSVGHAPRPPYRKYAASPLTRLAAAMVKRADPLNTVASWLAPNMPDASMWMPLGTAKHSTPVASAPYIPMAIGGAGAGLYGGWKLVDHILNKHREVQVARELDRAKQDYRKALNEQFQAQLPPKPEETPGAALDKVAQAFEKQGGLGDYNINLANLVGKAAPALKSVGQGVQDRTNELGGAYATMLGLTGLGSYLGAKNWTQNRSEAVALEKALRQRRLDRAARPAPVMAVAKDVTPEEFERA